MPYNLIGINKHITGIPSYTKSIVAAFTDRTSIQDYLNTNYRSPNNRHGIYPTGSVLSGYLSYEIVEISGSYETDPGSEPDPPLSGFFVATSGAGGSTTGDGSLESPWDLKTALAHPVALSPGDTIYVRAGRYNDGTLIGDGYHSTIAGTSGNRITVRNYPGETPYIDFWNDVSGAGPFFLEFKIEGAYTDFIGLEIGNTNPHTRFHTDPAHDSGITAIGRGQINVYGTQNRIINCVVHDLNGGANLWKELIGGELHGCLIYNIGWDTPTGQWDHGCYTQSSGAAVRYYRENLIFNCFGAGMHAYGGASGPLQNMTFEGNVCFQNSYAPGGTAGSPSGYYLRDNFLAGGTQPLNNFVVNENYTYSSNFDNNDQLGYRSGTNSNGSATFTNNYFYSGKTYFRSFSSLTSSGNQTRSVDGTSTGSSSGWITDASPTGTQIDIRPNGYESGRGHIIIYNWDDLTGISVDVSIILTSGNDYEIYHVYDLSTPILSGTYSGGSLTIPMNDISPPALLGITPTGLGTPIDLPSTFGVFLVITT